MAVYTMHLLGTSPRTDAGGGRAEWDMISTLKWWNKVANKTKQSKAMTEGYCYGVWRQRLPLLTSGQVWEGEGIKERQEGCIWPPFNIKKGILREGYCKLFTLELWVCEGEEEKREIMKER